MAQPLVVKFDENKMEFQLSKIDRSDLYGSLDVETLDEKGRPCRLATICGDGKTLVGTGGTAMANISPDGEWRDKSELTPVDMDGKEVTPVPSTFKTVVSLDSIVDIDEFLNHNIRSVYLLEPEQESRELLSALKKGKIYSFDFSYRGALEADTAFLLAGPEDEIFMAVGKKTDIRFVGFEQAADISEDQDEEDEDDDMDFGMM